MAKLFLILLVTGALVDQLSSKEPPLLIDSPTADSAPASINLADHPVD